MITKENNINTCIYTHPHLAISYLILLISRPLGFLDEPSNRWGVMLAFGSVTGNILHVTLKLVSKELDWPIWGKSKLILGVIIKEVTFVFYKNISKYSYKYFM
jgi:hypothetical protein